MLTYVAALILAPSPTITKSAVARHVEVLASPAMEGRLTLTPGIEAAAQYIAQQFKAAGVKPWAKNSYFHTYQVQVGHKPGAGNYLGFEGVNLKPKLGVDYLPLLGSPNAKAVEGGLVFAGFGTPNDYTNIDVRGKVVLLLKGEPSGPVISNGVKARTAKERGAVGALFVGSPKDGMPELPNFNAGQGVPADLNMPAVSILSRHFEKLAGVKYAEERANPRPRKLEVQVQMKLVVENNEGIAKNVIGVLPGTDPKLKGEYIIFGAHYDHLGYGEVGSRTGAPAIHFGADDNASGTAAVLALAEHFAKEKSNKRTLIFQLYSGEEEGLLGSQAWVKHNPDIVAKTTAMINLDMVGRLREERLYVFGTGSSTEWDAVLKTISEPGARFITSPNVRADSDQAAFAAKQVPVLFLHTGLHEEYHTERDSIDTVNPEGIAVTARVAAKLVGSLDKRPKLSWNPSAELGNRPSDRDMPGHTGAQSVASGGQQRSVRIGFMPDMGAAGPGVVISGTTSGSPAEKAGFKPGDRILEMNGQKLEDLQAMSDVMKALKPGDKVKVVFERDGKRMEAELTAEAR